ncbi:MAG: hypothetical protein GF372_10320 [Candidatus Marinimicrobia bacterium]|nr:hypothetical protein [Candidatus Neomarinimicrobiota bacterium]
MIWNVVNTAIGLTIEKKAMQFSNEYHDDYHIQDYLFRNTGNVDETPGIELDGQDLEDVYIMFLNRYRINGEASGMPGGTGWGRNSMHDVVGDGFYDYGMDLKAVYSWHGRFTEFTAWDNIGAPAIDSRGWNISSGDTIGRLVAATMVGRQTLHADQAPRATPETGYPLTNNASEGAGWTQPATTHFMDTDLPITTVSDQFDEGRMREEYETWATAGNVQPFHAETVHDAGWAEGQTVTPKEWREHYATQTNRPDYISLGGFQNIHAYGPYDIPFGETVRIVLAEGVNGLSRPATFEIGRGYKAAHEADDQYRDIAYDANGDGSIQGAPGMDFDGVPGVAAETYNNPLYSFSTEYSEYMNKNEWVMTARDSLFETFRRAKANYTSGFDIPQAPKPPKSFTVSSGAEQIVLEWDVYEQEGEPSSHWEIWRGEASIDSFFVRIGGEIDPSERTFTDTDATRGINYYYYIQAVDNPVTDNVTWPGGRNVTLKSNRHYTQTYAPASLKRGPGEELADVRVVPNPYNLAADRNIRWPDLQDKLGFLNIPGECTIKIYTEAGELVREIEHTDGSGDEYWSLTTEANQLVVSGIYFAVITDNTDAGFGDSIIRKFTIIR